MASQEKHTPHPRHNLHHWLRNAVTALVLGTLWLLSHLPFKLQMALGDKLGALLLFFMSRRRHIAEVNLRLCFPDMPQHERKNLVRRHFSSLGKSIFESALSWWASSTRLERLIKIDGLENLQQALAAGKGVILLSAHFTTLEIGARLISIKHPIDVVYRPHKNMLFERIMTKGRNKHFNKSIQNTDMRKMMRSLRENRAVWYAPDQNQGIKHGLFVPFFNVPAATLSTTSRIALKTGAKVVPFIQKRLDNDSAYQLTILPALTEFPSDDIAADTRRITTLIESWVLETKEQYLWTHRRFKTRPEGEADVYSTAD